MSGATYYAPVFNPPPRDPTATWEEWSAVVWQGDAFTANRYGHVYTFYPAKTPNCAPLPTHAYERIRGPYGPYTQLSPFFDRWQTCYNDTVAQIAAVTALRARLITRDGRVLVDFPPPPSPPPPTNPGPLPPAPPPPAPPAPLPAPLPAPESAPAPLRRGALVVGLASAGLAVAAAAVILGKPDRKR